jgi:hypothetical protein
MAAAVTHHTPPKRDERKINTHKRAYTERGRGDGLQDQAWADRVACPGCGGRRWHLAQAPLPAPPHSLGHWTQPLKANCYLKVIVPKSTNVTFQEQQKWVLLWSLNFSFKTSYTFGFSVKILSLQILALVIPYGTVIALGYPLNALL